MKTKMSYLCILRQLYEDVESDMRIPKQKREEILDLILKVSGKLWSYSA